MKKNGFTLIELLAVITILAITAIIVIVKIDKNIKDSQDFADDMQIKNIENAALTYSSTYIDEIVDFNTKKVVTITVATLVDKGILKKKDVDSIPVTNNILICEINGDIKVKYLESLKNVIFLIGPSSMSLYVNDTYKEMGAYVAIPSTGLVKLSDSNISSNLNTSATGSYEVTYSYDNADSIKRIVEIIN